jgi:hypothetical protein
MAAVATRDPDAFVPESLDTLPHALPRVDSRWQFGPRRPKSTAHTRGRRT